jgi:hypothetical protein
LPTKEELSQKLNSILGLEEDPIHFEKLSKDELERLLKLFSNLVNVAQIGMRTARTRLEEGVLFKPVSEVASMRVIDLVSAIKEQGGLIGLLDSFLQARRKRFEKG